MNIDINEHELYNGFLNNESVKLLEHGLKNNPYLLSRVTRIIDNISVSRNNLNRSTEFLFYDFNYPKIETCKEILKKKGGSSQVDFLMVLFDWYELYDKNYPLVGAAYSLAIYLKRYKYINYKSELEDENIFFDELRTENIDLFMDDVEMYEHAMKKLYEIEHYDFINEINIGNYEYTKYEIVNNFDIAYKLYKDGDRSNEVLSKLFSVNPEKYVKYIDDSEFFLIFARHDIDCYCINWEGYKKFKYNILYINILFPNTTQYYELYIDIPEYNLYVAAVKMNNKRIIEVLLKLFEEHGKFYKKMDLEKQIFIDEESYEMPEVEPLNLITGDILNPYHELKKTRNYHG